MSETNIKKFKRRRAKRLYYFDYSLFLILIILFAFGMVMLYSVSAYQGNLKFGDSTYYLKRQAFFGAIGMLLLFIVIKTGYAFLDKLSGLLYAGITSPHLSLSGNSMYSYLRLSGYSARTRKSSRPLSSLSAICSVSPLVMW